MPSSGVCGVRMEVFTEATLGCGRPQKRPQKRPQLEFLEIFVACPPVARAVKGGEAEAPDVSAPTLEGPESHL